MVLLTLLFLLQKNTSVPLVNIMAISSVYSFENEVFANFVFYGTMILIKVVVMSNITSFYRLKNDAHSSSEDLNYFVPNHSEKHKKMIGKDEDVERVSKIVFLITYRTFFSL